MGSLLGRPSFGPHEGRHGGASAPPDTRRHHRPAAAQAGAFAELAKPGIAAVVVMTASAGFLLGSPGSVDPRRLVLALAGTGLAAAGAGALNMLIERASDGRMLRTRERPLPSQRVEPWQALAFGAAASVAGVATLSICNNPLAGAVAAASLALYLFLYTPMKKLSAWCMVPGSVSGALPPLIGYAAAAGRIDAAGLGLFLILFLWQFPHIVALAWMYREDYERGGLRMLPDGPTGDAKAGFLAAGPALLLIPVAMLPMRTGAAGPVYGAAAVLLGALYAGCAIRFAVARSLAAARSLFFVSISYIPILLIFLATGR